jgi:predicted ferric reductase
MPLLHFYVVAGFLLLALFYKEVLSEYINTRIIWFVAILFSLFSIFNSIWLQPIKSFNSNALTVQSVLILIVTIFTYIVFLNKIVKEKNKKDIPALNWINSGLFIYNASNLLIFYFGSSMMRSAIVKKLPVEMVVGTWLLHAFFLAIMYICFLIGLFKAQKE